jgi:hypothetical protein
VKPFTVEIEIEQPRARVIESFDNPENLVKWQPGLQRFEHVSGTPGQPGAKSILTYNMRGRTMELLETVPEEFNGKYEWRGGYNTLRNRFTEVGPARTRWESTCEYHFTGLMPRIMGMLFPGMFRKQTLGFLKNFKAFCENGRDVRTDGPA